MVNSEQKTIIDIDTESFQLKVREWNSLTRGFINSITEWMKREATEKEEEVEKPPAKEKKVEEEPSREVPTEKTPSGELQKTIPIKSLRSSGTRMMSEDHLLKRYDNGAVWDIVLDYICANVPDEFKREDVAECVSKYYETESKRMVKPSTANNYAGIYIKYMREEDTPYRIERCDDPNVSPVVLYRRVKPEKPMEEAEETKEPPEEPPEETKPSMSVVAVAIYDLAKEKHWVDTKRRIDIVDIGKNLPEYALSEIEEGLACLNRTGKMMQYSSSKVTFK